MLIEGGVLSQITLISWGKYSPGAAAQHEILMPVQLLGVMGVFNLFFFSLFTVSIRARPGSSICVFNVGVSEQALHRDAHSPGKDVPLALLQQLPSPTLQAMYGVPWPCHHGSR